MPPSIDNGKGSSLYEDPHVMIETDYEMKDDICGIAVVPSVIWLMPAIHTDPSLEEKRTHLSTAVP
jgi:hypothetical protein